MSLIEQFSKSPKDFPETQLLDLAKEVRTRIIEVVSQNGGHLASSLGAVELVIALLKVFDSEKDPIVWDVGHQTYAWKILTGRNDRFDTLRKKDGISGFPRRDESKSDAFGAGHAGVAISAALGLAAARDQKSGEAHKATVVAVVGDAALANGISLEALNNATATTKRLILILNDNKMSISDNVGALSRHFGRILASRRYNKIKTGIESFAKKLHLHWLSNRYHRLESQIKSLFVKNVFFEELGLRYIGPLDGHNIERLIKALTIARDYNRPITLHITTQKGRGYGPAEKNPAVWHGVAPFDITSGKLKTPATPGFSEAVGEAITEAAKKDKRVIAITAAMRTGTGLDIFQEKFPDRFFDVGICEEHAVSFAAGLAAGDMRPFVALYSSFAQRAIDSVFHDICLQGLPATICLDRAGIVGSDGMTHHGLYDIPLLRPLPKLVLAQPRDASVLRQLIDLSLENSLPFAIRYPRGACPKELFYGLKKLPIGKAQIVRKPSDAAQRRIWIWALGDMLPTAIAVAEKLEAGNIASVGVVDPIFIKPLDQKLLNEHISEGAEIVTIENGALQGGFGSALLEAAAPYGNITRFGWEDDPVPHGKPEELFQEAGLDAASIGAKLTKQNQP